MDQTRQTAEVLHKCLILIGRWAGASLSAQLASSVEALEKMASEPEADEPSATVKLRHSLVQMLAARSDMPSEGIVSAAALFEAYVLHGAKAEGGAA